MCVWSAILLTDFLTGATITAAGHFVADVATCVAVGVVALMCV